MRAFRTFCLSAPGCSALTRGPSASGDRLVGLKLSKVQPNNFSFFWGVWYLTMNYFDFVGVGWFMVINDISLFFLGVGYLTTNYFDMFLRGMVLDNKLL